MVTAVKNATDNERLVADGGIDCVECKGISIARRGGGERRRVGEEGTQGTDRKVVCRRINAIGRADGAKRRKRRSPGEPGEQRDHERMSEKKKNENNYHLCQVNDLPTWQV